MTPKTARKPGQRKRVRNAKTTTITAKTNYLYCLYLMFIKYLGFIVFTSLKQYFILAKLFKVKFTTTKISCDFLLTFFNIIARKPGQRKRVRNAKTTTITS
jgi:hypothetical protein